MASGAEVISTKFFHAFGYHTPENYLATLRPELLTIDPATRLADQDGRRRPHAAEGPRGPAREGGAPCRRLLPRAGEQGAAGQAARSLPLLRHAVRRPQRHPPARAPPRAARAVRVRRVAEPRRLAQHQHARRAGARRRRARSSATTCSISGPRSAAAARRRRRQRAGNEFIWEARPTFLTMLTLGFYVRPWVKVPYPEIPAVGRIESDVLPPRELEARISQPRLPQRASGRPLLGRAHRLAALRRRRAGGGADGQFSDPQATTYLTETILARKAKVLMTWLNATNPVINVSLDDEGVAALPERGRGSRRRQAGRTVHGRVVPVRQRREHAHPGRERGVADDADGTGAAGAAVGALRRRHHPGLSSGSPRMAASARRVLPARSGRHVEPRGPRAQPLSGARTALLLAAGLGSAAAVAAFGLGRLPGEMRDFEVYWTAAARALDAQPLYRAADGHFQFKYLPAFAVMAAPVALLPLPAARAAWFVASVVLLVALVWLSLRALPERRLRAGRARRRRRRRDGQVLRPRARARPGEHPVRGAGHGRYRPGRERGRGVRRTAPRRRGRGQALRGHLSSVDRVHRRPPGNGRRRRRRRAPAPGARVALRRGRHDPPAPRVVAHRDRLHGAQPHEQRQRLPRRVLRQVARPHAGGIRRHRAPRRGSAPRRGRHRPAPQRRAASRDARRSGAPHARAAAVAAGLGLRVSRRHTGGRRSSPTTRIAWRRRSD